MKMFDLIKTSQINWSWFMDSGSRNLYWLLYMYLNKIKCYFNFPFLF